MWVVVLLAALQLQPASEMTEEEAVRMARAELRERLGDAAAGARVSSVEEVEWPSTALGCPEEGMMYAQVLTPGYRVVLEVNGRLYRAHVGSGRAVLCGEPLPAPEEMAPSIPDPTDPARRKLVAGARKDLAARLSVAAEEIELIVLEDVVWPDGSLGCPKPGMVYPQVLMDGARIRLRVGRRTYDYHSGGNREPFLCESPKKD